MRGDLGSELSERATEEGAAPRARLRVTIRPRAGLAARLRDLGKALLDCLPHTRVFDHLHALCYFVYANRRLPRRDSGLLNDRLFFVKTGPELRGALAQFTSDKVYAKLFIDAVVGRKVTPETHAVFHSVAEIRRDALPARCVIKAAHGTGCTVYLEQAEAQLGPEHLAHLDQALSRDIYRETREPNYRYLQKRLICEELMDERDTLTEYKLFCHGGAVGVIVVGCDWNTGERKRKQNWYDADWNRLNVTAGGNPRGAWEEMPALYPEMRHIAEKLATWFELVRVDMYLKDGRVYVGELTHCHNQGNSRFASLEEERTVSRLLFG